MEGFRARFGHVPRIGYLPCFGHLLQVLDLITKPHEVFRDLPQ
jgi:hypothetical protein